MTIPMATQIGTSLLASRKNVLTVLNITEDQFEYMLNMFSLDQCGMLFTQTQLNMFIDYQTKTGNVNIKQFDETLFQDVTSTFEEDMAIEQPVLCFNKIVSAPHQIDAKEKVIEASKSLSRMQIVSACGSGKTHIAQIITEEILPDSAPTITLILLPSLALVSQFYASWVRFTNIDDHRTPFVVCSDQDVVNIEGASITKDEYDFMVNTSQEYVLKYLQSDKQHKLIFSTYQSVEVFASVANAIKAVVDFGIFDEAHKTSGEVDKNFSFALFDENIMIKKRLFMTATQKNYIYDTFDQNMLSMDDESLYGPVVYELPMRNAIELGIIKDYKIIVLAISAEMVKEVRKLSKDKSFEDIYDDVLAYAFLKAVKEKNIKKSLIFHSNIGKSKKFCQNYLVDQSFGADITHIDGYMRGSDRNKILRDFNSRESYHVSNSKLFSEGVDVPSIDMIGLFNPSKSVIDITQRIGRVQRKVSQYDIAPGYVFLPLFLDEAIDEVGDQKKRYYDWRYIVDVLNFLKESDSQIRTLFDAKFKNDEYLKDSSIRDVLNNTIEFVSGGDVEDMWGDEVFKKIIGEVQVKFYSNDTSAWDITLQKVLAYKNEHGNFPSGSEKKEPAIRYLGLWCRTQRQLFNKNLLTPYRIRKLNDIGFSWDPLTENWNNNFEALTGFIKEHGRFPQTKRDGEWLGLEERRINKWLNDQKRQKKKGSLELWKLEKLKKIVTVWDSAEDVWNGSYKKFMTFVAKNKRLPIDKRAGEERLYSWINGQRKKYIEGTLDQDKIDKLNESNLQWGESADDVAWNKNYSAVAAYIKRSNRFPRDSRAPDEEGKLAKWCSDQRSNCKKGMKKMTPEKIEKLLKLGVIDANLLPEEK